MLKVSEAHSAEGFDAKGFSESVRPQVKEEARISGIDLETEITRKLKRGKAYIVSDDHGPIFLFGVVPETLLASDTGHPWMLASERAKEKQIEVARFTKRAIEVMLDWYPRLVAAVHEKDEESFRWLRWLGFKFEESPRRINGERYSVGTLTL